jgi:uncharacterized protein (TIGR03000 family)
MWKHTFFVGHALLAAVMMLTTPDVGWAQHRGGGGGHGGGWSGGHGGGWNSGRGNGWGGFYAGLGTGLVLRGYGGYGGYGYSGYPGYGYGGYSPYYSDSQPYYQGPYYGDGSTMLPGTGYVASYPPSSELTNAASIVVLVPSNAEVWFDGTKTSQTGSDRLFTTPSLTPGNTYSYEIRATWTANGAPVTQTRQVQVEAGKRSMVNFMEGK